ncbi:MAG: DUF2889 domain-containing protein [Burkholderiales bacterium]|nr:DUF2889 domain-containing protein [Burkholderiales bacterium]
MREELHHRQIDLRFYSRSDGLYEVEGRLIDTKTLPFKRQLSPVDTPAGAPIHNILVRLIVDETLLVHDAVAIMNATPFDTCTGAATTLAPLKGLRIGQGWNTRIREHLSGAASCTPCIDQRSGERAATQSQGQQLLCLCSTQGSSCSTLAAPSRTKSRQIALKSF